MASHATACKWVPLYGKRTQNSSALAVVMTFFMLVQFPFLARRHTMAGCQTGLRRATLYRSPPVSRLLSSRPGRIPH